MSRIIYPILTNLSASKRFATLVAVSTVGLTLASLGFTAVSAEAASDNGQPTILRSYPHGSCLDSNPQGQVYPVSCSANKNPNWQERTETVTTTVPAVDGFGNHYNKKVVYTFYELLDNGTGRCLDSNQDGAVYTNPCQDGNPYQAWSVNTNANVSHFVDYATSRTLQFTPDGSIKTDTTSGYDIDIKRGF